MSGPSVSVCIPVLNGAHYLRATIVSCLRQRFQDFELIVLDNGSTDATTAVVAAFNDYRIRLVSQDVTLPIDQSWNTVVRQSRAPYIKLLCADDILDPGCLDRQLSALSAFQSPEAAFAFSPRRIIDSRGDTVLPSRPFARITAPLNKSAAIEASIRLGRNIFGEPLAVLFRRSAFDGAGGFRGQLPYCIDWDLWCRMLDFGGALFVPHEAGAFRVSAQSLSARLLSKQSRQQSELLTELYRKNQKTVAWAYYILGRCRSFVRALGRGVFYLALGLRARISCPFKQG